MITKLENASNCCRADILMPSGECAACGMVQLNALRAETSVDIITSFNEAERAERAWFRRSADYWMAKYDAPDWLVAWAFYKRDRVADNLRPDETYPNGTPEWTAGGVHAARTGNPS